MGKKECQFLKIDPNNIFLVGQSRGSLAVLTGLMNDQADNSAPSGSYRRLSSKPKAVFGAQAQATYNIEQLKTIFLKQKAADSAIPYLYTQGVEYQSAWQPVEKYFDYHVHYNLAVVKLNYLPYPSNPMSALDELTIGDPPVWLRYDRTPISLSAVPLIAPYVLPPGEDQNLPNMDTDNCFETPEAGGCLDVHHPNFGLALNNKYLEKLAEAGLPYPSSNPQLFVQYMPGVLTTKAKRDYAALHFYDNYYCFFIQQMSAPDNANRKAGVPADGGITTDCMLGTGDTWPIPPYPGP